MKRRGVGALVAAAAVAMGGSPADAGLWDKLKGVVGTPKEAAEPAAAEDLGLDEVARGLREALAVGAQNAVSRASAEGGFLDNPAIRIPLPDRLQTTAGVLRRFGLGDQVDLFQQTLNRAAEQAAGEALPIFSAAISNLTFDDVRQIWKGGDTAATEYLERQTRGELYERFRPVVHEASMDVGVTRAYQSMVGRPEVATFVKGTDLDLDDFVTDRALEGIFRLLAKEEQTIRTDPLARTTDLLRNVFGGSAE